MGSPLLDCNHYSMISELFSLSYKGVDLCALPYVHRVNEYIWALSLLCALESVLFSRLQPPILPRALEKISTNCSKFWPVKEGDVTRLFDNRSYEILWPLVRAPSKPYEEIIDFTRWKDLKRLEQEDKEDMHEIAGQYMEQSGGIGGEVITRRDSRRWIPN